MKVNIDTDVCIGFGNCEKTCPKVFSLYAGISTVQMDEIPREEEECVLEAESQCPSGAITVEK